MLAPSEQCLSESPSPNPSSAAVLALSATLPSASALAAFPAPTGLVSHTGRHWKGVQVMQHKPHGGITDPRLVKTKKPNCASLGEEEETEPSPLQTQAFSNDMRTCLSHDGGSSTLRKCPGESVAHVPQEVCANTFKVAPFNKQPEVGNSIGRKKLQHRHTWNTRRQWK